MNNKKIEEIETLNRCIKLGLKQGGLSKRIVNTIKGEDFQRRFDERPDFIKVYQPQHKHAKPILIGIEHFMVDQQSQKKGESYRSSRRENKSKIDKIYKRYKDKVQDDEHELNQAFEELSNEIPRTAKTLLDSSYDSYFDHFKYVLCNHCQSFDEYSRNLKLCAGSKYDYQLALLIEVNSHFTNYFLYDDKGISFSKEPIVPLFTEVVDLIKETCSQKISFIIFDFEYFGFPDMHDVIAVRPKTIEEDIRKQGYRLYEYVNTDSDVKASIEDIRYVTDNDNYILQTKTNVSFESQDRVLKNIFADVFKITELKRNNLNYVTKETQQFFIEELMPYVDSWKVDSEDEDAIIPIFNKKLLDIMGDSIIKRSEEFDHRWNLNSK